MGQIFNRIKNISKSYLIDSGIPTSNANINEKDRNLKKIIDELNNQKNAKTSEANPKTDASAQMNIAEAYNILEIESDATTEEIKSAYKKKLMEYHPDRVESLGQEIKELAKKKTLLINQAYELIKKNRGFN